MHSQKSEKVKTGEGKQSVAGESISAAAKQNMCMFSCVFWDFTRFSDIKRTNEWVRGSFYLHNHNLAGLERAALSLRKERSLIFVEKAAARVFPPRRCPAVVAGSYRLFDPRAGFPGKAELPSPARVQCSGSPAGNVTVPSAAEQPSCSRATAARTAPDTQHVS